MSDLDLLTVGLVLDMWTEKDNDSVKYDQLATQEDFDRFQGGGGYWPVESRA